MGAVFSEPVPNEAAARPQRQPTDAALHGAGKALEEATAEAKASPEISSASTSGGSEDDEYKDDEGTLSRCLSEIESLPDTKLLKAAAMRRHVTAPAVMQVANWTLEGEMTVLYEGSGACLTNSKVQRGSVRPRSSSYGDGAPESPAQDVAVKSVSLTKDEANLAMMKRECSILEELGHSHPHILPSLGFAELGSEMVLLTRLAPDGDLSRMVPTGRCLEELEVRKLHQQLLSALAFLEDRRVVHGDVKPANVLLTQIEGALLAQLADFGLAAKVPEGDDWVMLEHVQGSYGYIASEVKHRKQLSFAADLFALGVMTFRLLSSYDPFYPASAVDSELLFDPTCWSPLSPESKALVTALLARDPEIRGSASKLLEGHPWLVADESSLAAEPRKELSPLPLQTAGFHTLEASSRLWQSERQSLLPVSEEGPTDI